MDNYCRLVMSSLCTHQTSILKVFFLTIKVHMSTIIIFPFVLTSLSVNVSIICREAYSANGNKGCAVFCLVCF